MKEIGGYFELELNKGEEYYPNSIKLNSGRNALLYILKAYTPKKIFIPKYVCDSVLEPIIKMKIEFEFYYLKKNLDPILPSHFESEDFLLYVNYFGIKDDTTRDLADKIGNMIVDNSQAFYSKPFKLPAFYSPRKFFGVADGAYLFTEKIINDILKRDISHNRSIYLLKRLDLDSQQGYQDYFLAEESFSNEPIKIMSKSTQRILASIDYERIKNIREKNFLFIHNELKGLNELNLDLKHLNGPMKYPFLIQNENLKDFLIKNKIYASTYWKEVLKRVDENSFEYYLTKYLVPLPIDQRYNENDMAIIIKKINEVL